MDHVIEPHISKQRRTACKEQWTFVKRPVRGELLSLFARTLLFLGIVTKGEDSKDFYLKFKYWNSIVLTLFPCNAKFCLCDHH